MLHAVKTLTSFLVCKSATTWFLLEKRSCCREMMCRCFGQKQEEAAGRFLRLTTPGRSTQIQRSKEEAQQCQQREMPKSLQGVVVVVNLLILILLVVFINPVSSTPSSIKSNTFKPGEELRKYGRMKAHLRRINKPYVKTIQSPDGDVIDCVPYHLQPAFDHPILKGRNKSLDLPYKPRGHSHDPSINDEILQSWRINGESCPQGTIPIRRSFEVDVLRATSIKRFGRKDAKLVRRDSSQGSSSGHEHAVGYVVGDSYYGAKASVNVWAPNVTSPSEFSLSQIWIISGSFDDDLNTIEAGWQVSPQLYGDNNPRFFTYWTTDAYQATGCYNLLCSGFIQTNNMIAIGAAISPTSMYNGGQFDISLLVWKDPKHGNWWLELGSGQLVGYWPSSLFSHLTKHASMVQFGGEIVNTQPSGSHTSTQMGSGRFSHEGFGKASYFRNVQVVDWDNSLIPPPNLCLIADHPDCYDIQGGNNVVWGNYFYYGGPGRSMTCL